MLVQFGTKCQSVSIYIYVTKYRTMYVVLNEYVTGCISYDTNMSYNDRGMPHIRYKNYFWLCKCEGHLLEWNGRIGE